MSATSKTFDDTYGRHALVYYADGAPVSSDKPAFGRTDIAHLVETRSFHPVHMTAGYQPTHAAGDAA